MKRILLYLLVLPVHALWSQSVDLDREYFDVSYVQLPTNPIENDQDRTFSVRSNNARSLMYSFSKYYFEQSIQLPGFTKFMDKGFLDVHVELQDVIITNSTVKTSTSSRKKKDGTVVRTTHYQAVIDYKTQGRVTISSNDGSINEVIDFTRGRQLKSKSSTRYEDARNFRASNNKSSIRSSFINNVVKTVNRTLADNYGYPVKKHQDHFWILDSRKHPQTPAHKKAYAALEVAFSKMNSAENMSAIAAEIAPQMKYFEEVVSQYPKTDRKSRKFKYASFYNLSKIYYYLDNPEKSVEYANKLIVNDFDEGDGKRLIKAADALSERFKANKVQSSHMEVITEDETDYSEDVAETTETAQPAVAEEPVELPKSEDPNFTVAFVATIKGDTLKTYVHVNKIRSLRTKLDVYVKDMEGKDVARSFRADEVEKLILGNGEEYTAVNFVESDSSISLGKQSSSARFVKEIIATKKMGLYQYYNGELILKKANESEGKNTGSAGWMLGFRKRLSKMVSDCPSLVARVKDKEFSNNASSLIQLVKAYRDCE